MLSRLTLTSRYSFAVIGLAICGLGTGLFMAPNNSALMGDASRNPQGIASGVLVHAFNNSFIFTSGVALLGAVISYRRGNVRPVQTLACNTQLTTASTRWRLLL